ncbi:MAG: cob(I)yrinic acid a,c-diamide adenosyltransferase [archaeon YNP-LCB-024-027]|jgi:cob(I)alamin adenosyltransferase|nr:cob(I)yrinic acid a,c-diamide adenosyltransferase [Candidatus Culexarchaeum yellowstonense]
MKPNIGAGDMGKAEIIGRTLDKTSPLIGLIGYLDELNSFIGFSRSLLKSEEKLEFKDLDEILKEIQNQIFLISSELAGADLKTKIGERELEWLENVIVKLGREIEPINNLIYPTGSIPSSSLHIARAFCRRVERYAFKVLKEENIRSDIPIYLNRLSDLLFTLARVVNSRMKVKDETWKYEE